MTEERTVCRTPTPGKKPTSIPRWKYEAVRMAILANVPAQPPGVLAKDLPGLVEDQLASEVRAKLGSVVWHVTTVKLELEVSKDIKRVPNQRPQRLIRC